MSVSPCVDFYHYANGGWIDTNPAPASYVRWGMDDEVNRRTQHTLIGILREAAGPAPTQPAFMHKLGDFYATAMDTEAIDRAGLNPLTPDLAAIAALRTPDDVTTLIIDWQAHGRPVLFDFAVRPDLHDTRVNIAYAGQAALGLPDRQAYLADDVTTRRLRRQYRAHITRMLALLGDRDAEREAGWALDFETRLARASVAPAAQRDPFNAYHIVDIAKANALMPHFSWQEFFHVIGRGDVHRFSMAHPAYFAAIDRALAATPVSHWQAWLRWRLIDADAPYLADRFVDADFDFRGRVLHGTRQDRPRWKRVLRSADRAMGELLGRAYVAKVFAPQIKPRLKSMVANLKIAMRTRIAERDWMGTATRRAALAKLDAMKVAIGYPSHWEDFSGLHIDRRSYLANMRAAAAFRARREFARIDRPIDPAEWDITPQTVNAYYNPLRNEIFVPAAQLQPPFFDPAADDALNYGAIGALIGHEMMHAFTGLGARFDATGRQHDWWTAADRAAFDARARKLVLQYNAYTPIDGVHSDGKRTLDENVADLGGLVIAYDAFKLTRPAKSAGETDTASADRRFFLSYARSWRSAQRPERLHRQLRSGIHAPSEYRVNVPLSDMSAFARAFACKPDDPMARPAAQRAHIWHGTGTD